MDQTKKQTATEFLRQIAAKREIDKFDWERATEIEKENIEDAFQAGIWDGWECAKLQEQKKEYRLTDMTEYYNKIHKK